MKGRKKTTAGSAMDVWLDSPKAAGTPRRTKAPKAAEATERTAKTRMTVHLPVDLVERVKDTTVALSGPPVRATIASLVGVALEILLAKLEKAHNRGKRFPARSAPVKTGRPIGS